MKLIRSIYSDYINPALIDYFYVGEASFKGEEGYTVEAGKGDSSIPLYFTDSRDVAEAYLLWLDGELGGGVNQWDFEELDEKWNTRAEESKSEPSTTAPDSVNHPSHYETNGIECIDAMIAAQGADAVQDFCVCNAFKYIWRHKHKNGAEDIKKPFGISTNGWSSKGGTRLEMRGFDK